jgi:hypothetical protein
VDSLRDINVTLKRYLEELVKKEVVDSLTVAKQGAATLANRLIAEEDRHLSESAKRRALLQNGLITYLASENLKIGDTGGGPGPCGSAR